MITPNHVIVIVTDAAGSNQKPTVTQAQAEAAAAGALLTLTQFLQGQGP